MKKGFTLAEVLITLAIIGVVAALTIPAIVAKYNQHAQYTQFMKSYNTLLTALSLSIAENGNPNTWTIDDSDKQGSFDKYFGKYLKIQKYCTKNASSCGIGENTTLKFLNSETPTGISLYSQINSVDTALILQDGTIIMSWVHAPLFQFFVDTNGIKGPNTLGRDFFDLSMTDENGKYTLGVFSNNLENLKTGSKYENCTTTIESWGNGCAARLLTEGKMNY